MSFMVCSGGWNVDGADISEFIIAVSPAGEFRSITGTFKKFSTHCARSGASYDAVSDEVYTGRRSRRQGKTTTLLSLGPRIHIAEILQSWTIVQFYASHGT